MITFEDRIEFEGIAPDLKFHVIRRGSNDWETTLTGVKDLETGEEETIVLHLDDMQMVASMALFIDAPAYPEVMQSLKVIAMTVFKNLPDHLWMIPPGAI